MSGAWKKRLAALILAIVLALLIPLECVATQTAQVNTGALILREKASKSSRALQTLSRGTKVTITGSSGSWYKVTYGKYTGYVLKQYVKVTGSNTATVSAKTTTSKSSSNSISKSTKTVEQQLRSIGKPSPCAEGDSGSNVKKLQRCLTVCGYYSGSLDGVYGSATTYAVKRLQRAKHLSQTGVATKLTIAAMFGEDISKMEESYPTERLDWFKNGTTTIPKGAVFEVKDCKTGKTFKCKRWSGANHMDSMPLTREDTAVMKSLYGSWSWRRRAILVKYNGHVYAASMNGMPHGTTTIHNNGFPGHFCIHFYGSKTHGTKRVDPTHENCVSIAMHYKW